MADDAARRRALQFAHDLREIRKSNGISIEDVHHESKIPVGLIESFEHTGLLDHVIFNRVYLRSFVRTYADVVGISPEIALDALEAALDGTYDRRLAVEYLGYDRLELPPVGVGGAGAVGPEDDLDVAPEPTERPREEESTGQESIRTPPMQPQRRALPQPVEATLGATPEPDWTSQSPPPAGFGAGSSPRRGGGGQWLYPLLGVGLLALVVWGVLSWMRDSGRETAVPAGDNVEIAAVDTTDEGPAVAEPRPVTLGDTMNVVITAANDKVEDIKVKVDEDLRRPYWFELGESRTFSATREIIIEQELDDISLTLQGVAYPTDRLDEQGRIVIDRQTALEFLGATE